MSLSHCVNNTDPLMGRLNAAFCSHFMKHLHCDKLAYEQLLPLNTVQGKPYSSYRKNIITIHRRQRWSDNVFAHVSGCVHVSGVFSLYHKQNILWITAQVIMKLAESKLMNICNRYGCLSNAVLTNKMAAKTQQIYRYWVKIWCIDSWASSNIYF